MHSRRLSVLLPALYPVAALAGPDVQSDADLLQRFVRSGDQQAFAALVRRHGPMVLAVCRRLLPDRHEAEDAFQATFLVLVRKSAGLRHPEQVASWLHGVAYRTALRLRQRAARWQLTADSSDVASSAEPAPLERLAGKEVAAVLDEEIQRLPGKYRLPVVRCYLQGQSYADAARSLGWPAGTVAVRLARARQLLRSRLVRRGLGLSATLLGSVSGQGALAAAVPGRLLTATVLASRHVASGAPALAGAVSHQVIALTEGVLQAMWISKLKTTLLTAVAAMLVAAGVSGVSWYVSAPAQAQPPDAGTAAAKDLDARLADEEQKIKVLERELLERKARFEQLRHGDALKQIEAALQKLRKAHAADGQRRAAVEEFARAYEQLKTRLTAGAGPVTQEGVILLQRAVVFHNIVSDGKVLEVDREDKKVLLSAGSKDRVRKGQLFRSYQGGKDQPNQTGWLRVTETGPRWSTATIVQEPNPGSPVRPGDILQVHEGAEPEGLRNDAGR
jgi:RNA polymerase sigma factor (sigma-70 family)